MPSFPRSARRSEENCARSAIHGGSFLDTYDSVFQKISAGLQSPDAEIRRKCVLYLARVDSPRVIDILTPVAESDGSQEIRETAAKIVNFFRKKYSQAAQFVSAEQKQRIRSEIESSDFDPKKLVELILSDDVRVKVAAIQSFYGVRSEAILKVFKKFLPSETDRMVVATYIRAIGSIGGKGEIDFIRAYLAHPDDRVRSNTIEALCDMGAGIEILRDVLPLAESQNERLRITASQYLSRIESGELMDALATIMRNASDPLAATALRVSFFYSIDDTISLYREIYDSLSEGMRGALMRHLADSMHPLAEEFMKSFDRVKFDIAVGEVPPHEEFDISWGRDIFAVEERLRNDELYFYGRGIDRLDSGDFEKAMEEFSRALKINPSYAGAWKGLAESCAKAGRYARAVECCDRAIALAGDEECFYQKGLALQKLGKPREAAACFDRAAELSARYSHLEGSVKQKDVTSAIDRLILEMQKESPGAVTPDPGAPSGGRKAPGEGAPDAPRPAIAPPEGASRPPSATTEKPGAARPEKTKKCLKCHRENPVSFEKCAYCFHEFAFIPRPPGGPK